MNTFYEYFVSVDFALAIWYNKPVELLSEFERYCLLLKAEEREFAKKIAGDDLIMKKTYERIEELNEDENILGLYDAEKEAEKVMRTRLLGAKQEGIEEGAKEEQQKIVKNLLNSNIPLETIAECTELSIEEIESLQ